ncbi:MAG: hypothetical protein NXI20_24750 [bacterium]|nr:hypothetical protein [bacterium]
MKNLLPLTLLVFWSHLSFGQNSSIKTKPVWMVSGPTILLANNFEARHTTLFYTDYKIDDLQVISVHQYNTPYDIVFYVDKKGNTQYKSMAPTGAMNTLNNFTHRYDSFNPYGTQDFGEAIFSGVLNTLFRKRNRNINFR